MRISFFGAARTVTGSQHLIEVNGKRILLDCGLYQGRRAEAFERNQTFPFDPKSLDAVILSHAHIDHSGNLPNLIKQGYLGEIIATHATRDLCASMLLDSGNIQERDVEFVNKKHALKGEPLVQPLYTQDDAGEAMTHFTALSYQRAHPIAPGVTLTFHDAGHMLGSAFVALDIEDHATKRALKFVFSGDLGRIGSSIIRDPEPLGDADVLIMESTYGDRLHPAMDDDMARMQQIIIATYQRGGTVLIPAFAVGRTQQVVYTLHQLIVKGDIPPIPIIVDSPLATEVTQAFRSHPECYDAEMRAFISTNAGVKDVFGFSELRYTRSVEESMALNNNRDPMIIIAPSGMMEYGRILHHLKHRIEDPKNTVLIVGWQSENTLGRRLVEGDPEVRIFGESYHNRIQTEVMNGFSGHADRDELLAWVASAETPPKRTFLVHGEAPAAFAFADLLRVAHPLPSFQVDVPTWKQQVEV